MLRTPGHYPILELLGRGQHCPDLGPVELIHFMTGPSQSLWERRPLGVDQVGRLTLAAMKLNSRRQLKIAT